MTRVFVKNGTPVEGQSLCYSCNHAHILRGYRECEELVFCNYVFEQLLPVMFKIRECTNYADRNKPTYDEMQKLAIEVRPTASYKPIGFKRKQEENDLEVEVAAE